MPNYDLIVNIGVLLAALVSVAKLLTPATRGRLGRLNYAAIIAIVVFALFVIFGLVSTWLYYRSIGVVLDERARFLQEALFLPTLFFAMLVGMVTKYFYELSKAGKGFSDAKPSELLTPLIVSLVVFFTAWGTVAGKPIGFLSVGLAIQNGFFWQDVVAGARPPGAERKEEAEEARPGPRGPQTPVGPAETVKPAERPPEQK